MAKVERVGIVFVHGIGEQRRFEHLDSEVRPFIDALRRRKSLEGLTIEIAGGEQSTLRADQDTWAAQPVRAVVREAGRETHIFFHEVWWADVNEPYSFKKEVSFWFWGLSVWAFPLKRRKLSGDAVMADPHFAKKTIWVSEPVARLRLFFVSNVFLMGAFSVGLITYFLKRVFNYAGWAVVRTFVNYVSAVKLYVQPRRVDGGFLDAYQEPPRVSVRRRMIRTITDVAMAKYDRWYIFAHSLGSVVAQNGTMENAHALPNYLDEKRWHRLAAAGLGGQARSGKDVSGDIKRMLPARPLWLKKDDVVYRDRLFGKFRGLLTYGSPLDKFAAIWPNRARINVKEKAFKKDAEWINVYDPTDPVSAHLDAYSTTKTDLRPRNYGYAAGPLLLASHLKYMAAKRGTTALSDRLAEWVLSGERFSQPANPPPLIWYGAWSPVAVGRRLLAIGTTIIAYIGLTLSSAFVLSYPFASKTNSQASPAPEGGFDAVLGDGVLTRLLNTLASDVWPFFVRAGNAVWAVIQGWIGAVPFLGVCGEWLGHVVHLVMQPFNAFGHWIRQSVLLLAGIASEPDGKLWNAMLDAVEFAPRLAFFVFVTVFLIGAVSVVFWVSRLKPVKPIPVVAEPQRHKAPKRRERQGKKRR